MPEICSVCLAFSTLAVQGHLLDAIHCEPVVFILWLIRLHKVSSLSIHGQSLILTQCLARAQDAMSKYTEHSGKLRKRLRIFISVGAACVMMSTVIVVMEAYTLLALQFCDGEDLMSLYWSTWTMIQIGSLIAIVGVILAMFHTLRNKRHP